MLGNLYQALTRELENGEEGHHEVGYPAKRVEQLSEFEKSLAPKASENVAHPFAHRQLLAGHLVMPLGLRAGEDPEPGIAEVFGIHVGQALYRLLLDPYAHHLE